METWCFILSLTFGKKSPLEPDLWAHRDLNLLCSDTENTEMLPCPKLQQNSRQHTSEYFKHTLACQLHFASVISKVCENTVRLDAKVTPKLRLRNGLVRETKPYLWILKKTLIWNVGRLQFWGRKHLGGVGGKKYIHIYIYISATLSHPSFSNKQY